MLSVKSDGNDIEWNGETDDEDMENGETGFEKGSAQVRNIRGPGQPTTHEHREHMTHFDHTDNGAVQALCDGTWCELAAQEIGCSRRFGRVAPCVNGLRVLWREGT